MTRDTEHHEWTIPTEGETQDWDTVLNDFFEGQLDLDVMLVGAEAERPPAEDASPTLFFASDTGRIDYNDGNQWHEDVVGSGALTIQEADADISTNVRTVNFENNLTVGTDGAGKVTVHASPEGDGGFSGSHDDLTDVSSDDHHTKYTDLDVRNAVEDASQLVTSHDTIVNATGSADPKLTFTFEGSDRSQIFHDEDADRLVFFHYGTAGRVLDIRPVSSGSAFNVRTTEMEMNGNTISKGVVSSGSTTLSSGSSIIDTGVPVSETATFQVALGPGDGAEVSSSIQSNTGDNYEVHIDETNTSVGDPTVEYDVIRVR